MTNTQSSKQVVLKVDTEGRVRTPKEKREEILDAYSGSGMTGRQFALYCGVKYSTLMNWVGKSRRAKKAGGEMIKPPGMSWVEATVEKARSGNGEGLSVEIGSVVRLEVFNSRQAALAGEFIRSLGVVRPC
jgi:transposase-like protein